MDVYSGPIIAGSATMNPNHDSDLESTSKKAKFNRIRGDQEAFIWDDTDSSVRPGPCFNTAFDRDDLQVENQNLEITHEIAEDSSSKNQSAAVQRLGQLEKHLAGFSLEQEHTQEARESSEPDDDPPKAFRNIQRWDVIV